MNSPTEADLIHWFQHHPPRDNQPERYQAIRDAGHAFALAVLRNTPPCADQSAAFRLIREAVFTANAAIALEGPVQSAYYAQLAQRERSPLRPPCEDESTAPDAGRYMTPKNKSD